jgi:hypothetical protein
VKVGVIGFLAAGRGPLGRTRASPPYSRLAERLPTVFARRTCVPTQARCVSSRRCRTIDTLAPRPYIAPIATEPGK